jgi:hypothetical protein
MLSEMGLTDSCGAYFLSQFVGDFQADCEFRILELGDNWQAKHHSPPYSMLILAMTSWANLLALRSLSGRNIELSTKQTAANNTLAFSMAFSSCDPASANDAMDGLELIDVRVATEEGRDFETPT